jgi:adenylyltransferase/sulfurtransferase
MNEKQKQRYNRHILLTQVGEEGQEKLLQAKVLVVGAGGLGSPVLQYLTAAGIGVVGIVDDDVVGLSNLQRQVLYREDQVGELKAIKAESTLKALNSDVVVHTYPCMLDEENAEKIISGYDVVVGATDNFTSRKLIDKATAKLQIPFVHGSIGEFEGQVSVFNCNGGISYSDLFPDTPDEARLPSGVIGVLPGIIGSLQATEVIKIILGIGTLLSGKLLIYNCLESDFKVLDLSTLIR